MLIGPLRIHAYLSRWIRIWIKVLNFPFNFEKNSAQTMSKIIFFLHMLIWIGNKIESRIWSPLGRIHVGSRFRRCTSSYQNTTSKNFKVDSLPLPKAGSSEPVDELHLDVGGNNGLLILEPVSRPHLTIYRIQKLGN